MTREEYLRYGLETGHLKFSEYLELTKPLKLPAGLEEAASEHLRTKYKHSCIMDEDDKAVIEDFIAGAKWQAEQTIKWMEQIQIPGIHSYSRDILVKQFKEEFRDE